MTSSISRRPSVSDAKTLYRFPYCARCARDTKHKLTATDEWTCQVPN